MLRMFQGQVDSKDFRIFLTVCPISRQKLSVSEVGKLS